MSRRLYGRETEVLIDNRLEGRLIPPSTQNNGWLAVISHPHPKLGGDLFNNVVTAIAVKLLDLDGIGTLRYNTRGVGTSKGSSTWTGVEERKDTIAAVRFASTVPGVKNVVLICYSFGAAVGLSVSASLVEEGKIQALVCIGYPKGFLASFLFSSHYSFIDPKSNIPKLFILGDSDNFTSVSTMKKIVEKVTEPKELIILENADHFCFDREDMITEPVLKFLYKVIEKQEDKDEGIGEVSHLSKQ